MIGEIRVTGWPPEELSRAALARLGASLPDLARHWLHWVSLHTGAPALLVAAVVIVVAWRLARKSARLVLEVGLVVMVLLMATRLQWIHW